jgi:hypothetical protein
MIEEMKPTCSLYTSCADKAMVRWLLSWTPSASDGNAAAASAPAEDGDMLPPLASLSTGSQLQAAALQKGSLSIDFSEVDKHGTTYIMVAARYATGVQACLLLYSKDQQDDIRLYIKGEQHLSSTAGLNT